MSTLRYLMLAVTIPILSAVLLQRYMFAGLEAPPSDYGTGSMFDQIAVRYDMINRVLAMGMDIGWRKKMVEQIKRTHPGRILDVATGTADVALLLAEAMPGAHVVGVDPSSSMLHIGRQKVAQHKLSAAIDLQLHDAQDLAGLERQSFDAATMSFGIRNVPDRSVALCQIHAVLKAGARFCILEFSEPDARTAGMLGAVARLFIRYVVPVLGGILSGRPREYWHLQSSIQNFPDPTRFGQLLENLDCADGTFRLDELVQLSFGSVQLYTFTTLRPPLLPQAAKE
jgi:demethylmenaquinone methyltransferase / 2-methoxy-6-polyprenyl-1,4-benzoquinol methylase